MMVVHWDYYSDKDVLVVVSTFLSLASVLLLYHHLCDSLNVFSKSNQACVVFHPGSLECAGCSCLQF